MIEIPLLFIVAMPDVVIGFEHIKLTLSPLFERTTFLSVFCAVQKQVETIEITIAKAVS
jgi:hypothetical protein